MSRGAGLLEGLKRDRRLRAECPCCGRQFAVWRAQVFHVRGPLPEEAQGKVKELREQLREGWKELREQRKRAREVPGRSRVATMVGQALEELVPRLQAGLNARDWRKLGDPIDFVVFQGLAERGRVESVRFVEVKTGGARLAGSQRGVWEAVRGGRVRFEVYTREGCR